MYQKISEETKLSHYVESKAKLTAIAKLKASIAPNVETISAQAM